MKIYLAHPFLTRKIIREWQLQTKTNHELINPFYGGKNSEVAALKLIDSGEVEAKDIICPPSVVDEDIDLIADCDILIAYVDGSTTYGTSMEIVYARFMYKKIWIVAENGYENHPWLVYHASRIFKSLDECREALK